MGSRRMRRRKSRRRVTKSRGHMTATRVRRIIGAELKRHTTSLNGTAPAVTGEIVGLTDIIVQGDTSIQRNGNWIRNINVHGTLSVKGQDATGEIVTVRAFVFRWDLDASDGPPVLSDIVSNDTAPGSQFNFENRGNFQILWTKVFNIVDKDNNPAYQRLLKIYIRTGRLPKILYNNALPKKNQLYFGIFSDTADLGDIPSFRLDLVNRFTDS